MPRSGSVMILTPQGDRGLVKALLDGGLGPVGLANLNHGLHSWPKLWRRSRNAFEKFPEKSDCCSTANPRARQRDSSASSATSSKTSRLEFR